MTTAESPVEAEPDPATLVAAFQSRVRSDPDATFLFDAEGNALTYHAAAQHLHQLLRMLWPTGEQTGVDDQPIGLYLPNSWTWAVGLLAVWSTGRAAACVGTQLKVTEALSRFRDVGVAHVVAEPLDEADREMFVMSGIEIASYRVGIESDGADAPGAPIREPRAEAEALVIFSSGTTGKPKVVRVPHSNLVGEHARDTAERFTGSGSFRPRTAPAQLSPGVSFNPFGHMAPVARLAFRLWIGRPLVLVPRFDLDAVKRIVTRWDLRTLQLMPAIIHALANTPDQLDLGNYRYVTSGTAPLSEQVRTAFEDRYGVPVLQSYGSTELGVLAVERLEDVEAGLHPPHSVGRAARGVTIRMVDADGQDVPRGIEGEVTVSFDEERLSLLAKSNISADEHGWIRTGDRGRMDEDGILSVIGRVDDLMIVGGFNVDPLEVEDALRASPGVQDAVVLGVSDERLGEVVGAALVWIEGASRDTVALAADVKNRLSAYKVPRVWVSLEELPLIGPGKIDRRGLRSLLAAEKSLKSPAAGLQH